MAQLANHNKNGSLRMMHIIFTDTPKKQPTALIQDNGEVAQHHLGETW
jgi:hypothetical protein